MPFIILLVSFFSVVIAEVSGCHPSGGSGYHEMVEGGREAGVDQWGQTVDGKYQD